MSLKDPPLQISSSHPLTLYSRAEQLVDQGERLLLSGDARGIEYFEEASLLSPESAVFQYRQGLALFEYGSEQGREKALLLANKKFRAAVAINSEFFPVWHAWGNTLAFLGIAYKEHHYFKEAEEKLRKAIAISHDQARDIQAELHWDYGVVWSHLANHSEEALDLQLAIEAYQKAASYHENLPSEFWKDFGSASLNLADQINDLRHHVKAISCFKHAVSRDVSCFEAWHALAEALESLYGHTHDEDHFAQAAECYASAAQLKPHDSDLWLDWAKFLCEAARRTEDIKRLHASIEKCQRAYQIDPENPLVLAIWAEALAMLGDLSERLDFLHEAENKIAQASELDPSCPDIHYSFGMCLLSFGHYFHDIDEYYQAIEKFQLGLSIDRTSHRLWHAIGSTYCLIGQVEEDEAALELSLKFYTKSIDLHAHNSSALIDYGFALSQLGQLTNNQKRLEESILQFEKALAIQKNAIYLHPDWLFHYAVTLDRLGHFYEEESYYLKALEILSHVLMLDPEFPQIHSTIGSAYTHLGDLSSEIDHFYRGIHHFKLALEQDSEDDHLLQEWAIALIHVAERTLDRDEAMQWYSDAEHKLFQSARLGNGNAYYTLASLFSVTGQFDKGLACLFKADHAKALPPLDEILQDDWLEDLRSTNDCREFLSNLEKRPYLQEER